MECFSLELVFVARPQLRAGAEGCRAGCVRAQNGKILTWQGRLTERQENRDNRLSDFVLLASREKILFSRRSSILLRSFHFSVGSPHPWNALRANILPERISTFLC